MAAHARICSPSDLLGLTALPAMRPVSPSAELLRHHVLLLCAWLDQAALGIAQRIFRAKIVTHEMTVLSQISAANFRWYQWAQQYGSEAEAVDTQGAVAMFNAAFISWATNVFLAQTEHWQPAGPERDQREAHNAGVVAKSAATLDVAAGALSAQITEDPGEMEALGAHWARIRAIVPLRAEGIGSTDGRALRAVNAAQTHAIDGAIELGERFDAAGESTQPDA